MFDVMATTTDITTLTKLINGVTQAVIDTKNSLATTSDKGVRAVTQILLSHEEKEEKRSLDIANDKLYLGAYVRDIHRWSEDMLTILERLENFMRERTGTLPSGAGTSSGGGAGRSHHPTQSRSQSRS
jgi:hypothetical protein